MKKGRELSLVYSKNIVKDDMDEERERTVIGI